jgi:aldehyde dehydrogenase (NAD+)
MSSKTIKIDGKDISIPTGLFINNEFIAAKSGKEFTIENPATGEAIISIQEGQAEDVDVAVKAARQTFRRPEWRDMNPVERGALLHKLADLMEAHAEELVAIEMLDTGKTYKQASTLDIPGSIGTLRYYAGWADKVLGLTSFNIPKTFAYTRREPVGVCGQIIPWKYVSVRLAYYQRK